MAKGSKAAPAVALCVLLALLMGAVGPGPALAQAGPNSTAAAANLGCGNTTDCWEPAPSMTTGGVSGKATAGNGRIFYIVGATGGEVYDIATKKWSTLPPVSVLPERCCVTATTGSDGLVYMIGGGVQYSYVAPLPIVEIYNPVTKVWTRGPDLDIPRADATSATGADGRIYAIGGYGPLAERSVEVYDPKNPSLGWVPAPSLLSPRSNARAVTSPGGRIYVYGQGNTMEAYDPAKPTECWKALAPTSTNHWASGTPGMAPGPDGRIYVMGGYGSGYVMLAKMEVYDPATNAWTPVEPMTRGRYNVAAVLGTDGRIYALGGADNQDLTATQRVEAYIPGPIRPPGSPAVQKPVSPTVNGAFSEYRIRTETPEDLTYHAIASGSDGNVWFTRPDTIGRMTPDGKLAKFAMPTTTYSDITAGPPGDTNMWFTHSTKLIGRISPEGTITKFPLPSSFTGTGARNITAGPDGNLWFTHPASRRIGRITPDGVITGYPVPTSGATVGITVASDGSLWFGQSNGIGRIDPATGVVTEYAIGGIRSLVAGSDGKVWFVAETAAPTVGNISPGAANPAASVVKFALGGGPLGQIASGPDGNLWVTDTREIYFHAHHKLIRINPRTPYYDVSEYSLPLTTDKWDGQSSYSLGDLTAGPGGEATMWFTQMLSYYQQQGNTIDPGVVRFDLAVAGDGERTYLGSPPSVADTCIGNGDTAPTPGSCSIKSKGPLREIIISPTLNCQATHVAHGHAEHYSDGNQAGRNGECGTFLAVDGALFGPQSVPCYYVNGAIDNCAGDGVKPAQPFTRVDQKGVSGSGTPEDPYQIVTTVDAGVTGLRITQTDSYVVGAEHYRTDVVVTNLGTTAKDWLLTRGGDCWLANDDYGWGRYNPVNGAVACTSKQYGRFDSVTDEADAEIIIEWTPISSGSHYFEGARGGRENWWGLVGDQKRLPDVCCKAWTENAGGLSWDSWDDPALKVAPGASVTRSHYTTYSNRNGGPAPTATISDTRVTEGDSGTTDAVFDVSLDMVPPRDLTVHYATEDNTAKAGKDYVARTDKVVFKAGETRKTISVPVKGDTDVEDEEAFRVNLSPPPRENPVPPRPDGVDDPVPIYCGGWVGCPLPTSPFADDMTTVKVDGRPGIATITDNDVLPQLSIGNVEVDEARSDSVPAVFTVSMDRPSTDVVGFDVATADGTATAGADYTAVSRRVEIPAGDTTATISVDVSGDTVMEEAEKFFVDVSNPTGATVSAARGKGTIADAAQEGFSVGQAGVTEGSTGTTPANFTVTLADAHPDAVSVGYAVSDGTARAGSDYVALAGTLDFAPGEVSKVITVEVMGDTVVEPTETFTVTLTDPVGAPVADAHGTGTGTISDDDIEPPPVVDPPKPEPEPEATTQSEPPAREPAPARAEPSPPGPESEVDVPQRVPDISPIEVAALPPLTSPPQPLPQPLSQAQVQQQAQQQAQQQGQQQAQQQAQQQGQQQAQAQSQGQAQAQAQLQTQVGMAAERQKETQVERSYASSTDGSAQVHLASARDPSRPATAPLLGFIAALMAAGMGLLSRNGTSSAAAHQTARTQLGSARGGRVKRRRR